MDIHNRDFKDIDNQNKLEFRPNEDQTIQVAFCGVCVLLVVFVFSAVLFFDVEIEGVRTVYACGGATPTPTPNCGPTTNDIDCDGVANMDDTDADGDGIPNNTDPDDDDDGIPDSSDPTPGGPGTDPSSWPVVWGGNSTRNTPTATITPTVSPTPIPNMSVIITKPTDGVDRWINATPAMPGGADTECRAKLNTSNDKYVSFNWRYHVRFVVQPTPSVTPYPVENIFSGMSIARGTAETIWNPDFGNLFYGDIVSVTV
ncbi:MAG: hypothetical protein HPY51_14695 [Candidatus Omnitrophica bacterium]|nr:hypothetical protein [Candidatus Omnitrophota bacterium]